MYINVLGTSHVNIREVHNDQFIQGYYLTNVSD